MDARSLASAQRHADYYLIPFTVYQRTRVPKTRAVVRHSFSHAEQSLARGSNSVISNFSVPTAALKQNSCPAQPRSVVRQAGERYARVAAQRIKKHAAHSGRRLQTGLSDPLQRPKPWLSSTGSSPSKMCWKRNGTLQQAAGTRCTNRGSHAPRRRARFQQHRNWTRSQNQVSQKPQHKRSSGRCVRVRRTSQVSLGQESKGSQSRARNQASNFAGRAKEDDVTTPARQVLPPFWRGRRGQHFHRQGYAAEL